MVNIDLKNMKVGTYAFVYARIINSNVKIIHCANQKTQHNLYNPIDKLFTQLH